MPYNTILKKLVTESNLTYAQIIDEYKKYSKKPIDKSYLSRLINSDITPSDDVSSALEKVFDTKTNLLVVEAYFDKAPETVQNFIDSLKDLVIVPTLKVFNMLDEKTKEALREEIYNHPIIELLEKFPEAVKSINTKKLFSGESSKGLGIKASDNGFEPIIPIGANINLKTKKTYQNGDIVAIKIDEDAPIIVRKYFEISKSKVMFIPVNFDKEPLIKENKLVAILGKVVSYSVNI